MTQTQKKQHQEDTIKLLDGAIVLYKRGDLQRKASWQCRLELGDGKRTRRSLKTGNQAVAERLAMDLYTQLKGRVRCRKRVNANVTAKNRAKNVTFRSISNFCDSRQFGS